jgi:hypothetical protein
VLALADQFFFIALDDRTGRPHLSAKVLGLGLAGALLGELILEERITVEADEGGRVRVLSRLPPADPLAASVLRHLVMEVEDHPVRDWLMFLARDSAEQVAERLRRAGHIAQAPRRLWRRAASGIYPPTDSNYAYGPTARLATRLDRAEPVSWQEAVLCGLVIATGLDGYLLYAAGPDARRYLRHIVEHLTPSLHALVWHLHAAVGDAVLTGRT